MAIDHHLWRAYELLRRRSPRLFAVVRRLARIGIRMLARLQRFELPPEQPYAYRLLTHLFDPATTALANDLLKPGMTAVDVGAHIGYFSRLFSRRVGPTGRVIAFEATPGTFDVLERNVRRYPNVTTVCAAVSSDTGMTTIYRTRNSFTNSRWPTNTRGAPVSEIQVPSTTLDDAIPKGAVDLIKIDVEGGELEVIQGMKEIISRSPELNLLVEFNPGPWLHRGLDPYCLLDEIERHGFLISAVDEDSGQLVEIDDRTRLERLLTRHKYVNLCCRRPREVEWTTRDRVKG